MSPSRIRTVSLFSALAAVVLLFVLWRTGVLAPSAAQEAASSPSPTAEATPAPAPEPTPEPTPEPLRELPEDWFDDALFLGDSITGSLYAYNMVYGGLGDANFLYVNGMACHHITQYARTFPVRGTQMEIEDVVAESGCGKLFLMLAMNDVGTDEIDDLRLCWETVLDRILERNPGVTVYVQSGTPILMDVEYFTRENMNAYNAMLEEVCASRGCVYVDITPGLANEEGYMKPEFSNDNFHMNHAGCAVWVSNLKDPASYSVTPVIEQQEETP